MRFDLSQVFKSQGMPVAFTFEKQAEALEIYGESIAFCCPIRFCGRARYTDEVIVVEGDIRADYRARCGRCGKALTASLHITATEEYARTADEDFPDRYLFQGDSIDFYPMVEDLLVLNMPMKHLCSTDCRGICPVCGADRNEQPCSCQTAEEGQSAARNPFEALRAWKANNNEED